MEILHRMEMVELSKLNDGTRNVKSHSATYPPISAVYRMQFLKRKEAWPRIQHKANAASILSVANKEFWTDTKFGKDGGVKAPQRDED